jgi:hypothetical protein
MAALNLGNKATNQGWHSSNKVAALNLGNKATNQGWHNSNKVAVVKIKKHT